MSCGDLLCKCVLFLEQFHSLILLSTELFHVGYVSSMVLLGARYLSNIFLWDWKTTRFTSPNVYYCCVESTSFKENVIYHTNIYIHYNLLNQSPFACKWHRIHLIGPMSVRNSTKMFKTVTGLRFTFRIL